MKDYAVCLREIIGFPGSGIQCRISHNLSKSAKIGSNTARLGVRNKEAGKVLMLFPLSFYTYLLCPLLMGTDIWQEIEVLNQEFVRLGISQSVDYEKYYLYSLITHSTAIEGSTLTELDTQLLFDEGVTAKGKPLVYHLMNEDLKKAYELAKEESAQNAEITPVFLQKLNAVLMRTTGSVYNVMGGSFDSSKGEFRLCGVTAGVGGCSYMSYPKVPAKVEELCSILREKQKNMETFRERYELSFNAHLNLVTVHPWVDGNGRTARLLMNYIQFCHHLFPTKIFKEDRGDYILSLRQSQEDENSQPFLDFMAAQLKKSFASEIEKYNTGRKKGFNLMF